MANESGNFDAHLAAAAGEDPGLVSELRACFLESMAQQIDLLQRARCDGNWITAAQRLKGLGASFHSQTLIGLADEALDGAPGDPVIIRRLAEFSASFLPSATN
ncbi:HPt (histidine-containing phosphotransfer) domain-containing protein [Altererythrobacter atlanticus]|uniref:Uncharacterized protein n=1 Tax=Croceibacterium atlanticum TaxID=1267766 RepID=A0A0F7KRC8_9SPHN|nr:hypothetical protein [Croceibacterium atlanticum]AKH41671.1 hypothetical protein WYH_00615 [Croceibacterium atlanticum]MBB5733135.1 HPt (histidine-containing phosphotransfer) domain-containing protein [Croceibacterium atlanticum]